MNLDEQQVGEEKQTKLPPRTDIDLATEVERSEALSVMPGISTTGIDPEEPTSIPAPEQRIKSDGSKGSSDNSTASSSQIHHVDDNIAQTEIQDVLIEEVVPQRVQPGAFYVRGYRSTSSDEQKSSFSEQDSGHERSRLERIIAEQNQRLRDRERELEELNQQPTLEATLVRQQEAIVMGIALSEEGNRIKCCRPGVNRRYWLYLLAALLLVALVVALVVVLTSGESEEFWIQIGQDLNGDAPFEHFGSSIALSADGTILAAGAPDHNGSGSASGQVRVFHFNRAKNQWKQLGRSLDGAAKGDKFGSSLALSASGTIMVVAADLNDENGFSSGAVLVSQYDNVTNDWSQLGNTIYGEASYDRFGYSVAISLDGRIIAVGAPWNSRSGEFSGNVRAFSYNDSTEKWDQLGQVLYGLEELNYFGTSVAISSDGTVVAAGGPESSRNATQSGHVQVFRYESNTQKWNQLGQDLYGEAAYDYSGSSVALSASGTTLAISAFRNDDNGIDSGSVRVFRLNSTSTRWELLGQDLNGERVNDLFGESVDLSPNGNVIAAGAVGNDGNGPSSGHVRVFSYNDLTDDWIQLGDDIGGHAANDAFGSSVAIAAEDLIVAAGTGFSDGGGTDSGQVRVFRGRAP